VTFTRLSAVEPDSDNLIISFKSLRDGLVDAGVLIDDDSKCLDAKYQWLPALPGKGSVHILIEEIET
jgi:Holliday junction resolvase RusA-like endonuclease